MDGNIEALEIGRLHFKKYTLENYLGKRGVKRLGRKKWQGYVNEVVEHLTIAIKPTDIVLSGSNVSKLQVLPDGARVGYDDEVAFLGGFRLWQGIAARACRLEMEDLG